MDFSEALVALKGGKRVARAAWPTPHWLRLFFPVADAVYVIESPFTDCVLAPWIGQRVGNTFGPWTPTQADVMACDWGFVGPFMENAVDYPAGPPGQTENFWMP